MVVCVCSGQVEMMPLGWFVMMTGLFGCAEAPARPSEALGVECLFVIFGS